jgi:hypothetical protein
MNSPRISALDIHEWLHENMKLQTIDVIMVQIDTPKRHVYLKLRDNKLLQQILQMTTGQLKYKHPNGEISSIKIETAGARKSRIRLANMPPEIPDSIVRNALAKYGEVRDITHENWANTYRYPVANGIRAVQMTQKTHIPSNIVIAGHRVLISYDGQPLTCCGCGAVDHLYLVCPNRRKQKETGMTTSNRTWADIAAGETGNVDNEPITDIPPDVNETHHDVKLIDETHQIATSQPTHIPTNKEDTKCERAQMSHHTQNITQIQTKVVENPQQSLEIMKATQLLETKQTLQREKETHRPTVGRQETGNDEFSELCEMSEQKKTQGGQNEPFRWAEDTEAPVADEECTNPNLSTSPKRNKKPKLEKR